MSEKLTACPFDGGEAWIVEDRGDNGCEPRLYRVQCKRCGASRGGLSFESEAVAAWNRRAPEPVQEMHELDAPACSKPGACASPACIVENTCLFPHVDGSAAVGEPVAWRYHYVRPGRPVHWTVRQKPIKSSPGTPGWCEVVAEPLYAQSTLEALVRERDEARAALAYVLDRATYGDSYGVHGSDFHACHFCTGGGAPGVELVHDTSCPLHRYPDAVAEWFEEMADTEARATKAEAERDEARDDLSRWMLRMADIREAAGVGSRPMLEDLPAEIGKLRAERDALAAKMALIASRADHVANDLDDPYTRTWDCSLENRQIIERSVGSLAWIAAEARSIPSPLPDGGRG